MEPATTLETTLNMERIIARIKTLTFEKKQLCLQRTVLENDIAYSREIYDSKHEIENTLDDVCWLRDIFKQAPEDIHSSIVEMYQKCQVYLKDILASIKKNEKLLPEINKRIATYNKDIAEQMALLGISDI